MITDKRNGKFLKMSERYFIIIFLEYLNEKVRLLDQNWPLKSER